MAVDLSQVGLVGLEHHQRTLNYISNRNFQDAATKEKEIQNDLDERQVAIENRMAQATNFDQLSTTQGKAENVYKYYDSQTPDLGNTSRPMKITARALSGAGLITAGTKMMKDAIEIDKDELVMAKDEQALEHGKFTNRVAMASRVAEVLADVGNEQQLFESIDQLVSEGALSPENGERAKEVGYSPEVVDIYRTKAVSVAQKLTLDMQAANGERAERNSAITQEISRANLKVAQDNLAERRKESDRVKSQGKTAGTPNEAQVKSTELDIIKEFNGGVTPEKGSANETNIKLSAQKIASRAMQMVKDNKAYTYPIALNLAKQESIANGELKNIQVEDDEGEMQTEVDFVMGKNPDSAIAVPSALKSDGKTFTSKEGRFVPDRKKMVKDTWYVTKYGPKQWLGPDLEFGDITGK